MAENLIVIAVAFLVCLNAVAYLAFAADKARARRNEWRIPEANLLFLALCGGILGAKLGQRLLRHKTRKQPFKTLLNGIIVLQLAVLVVFLFPEPRKYVVNAVQEFFVFEQTPKRPPIRRTN